MLGYARNRWLNVIRNSLKYGRFTTLIIPKCENFTLLVFPFRFLVIPAMSWLGNVQSFKTYVFRFWAFCHESDPARRVTPPWDVYMANCHPGWQSYPPWGTGQPAKAGHPTNHVNLIKIKQEIMWTCRLIHLHGLPHLHGVSHLDMKVFGNIARFNLLRTILLSRDDGVKLIALVINHGDVW